MPNTPSNIYDTILEKRTFGEPAFNRVIVTYLPTSIFNRIVFMTACIMNN
jgi:hypothetical protein